VLLQRYHTAVSAIGYDDKSGLLVIAGDSGNTTSSNRSSSSGGSQQSSSSGAVNAAASPAAAFAEEGVTVSVWQLQDRQLNLRFSKGAPKVRACGVSCEMLPWEMVLLLVGVFVA
jgi:hypothetical protein